jgi:hypothetical protein
MTRLSIRHETLYRYGQPVSFGPQRLMVRPRDSHAARLVEASLQQSPRGGARGVHDAMGNCLCLYQSRGEATVTGYLCSPKHDRPNCESEYKGASATHAWFDLLSPNLINIGVTRTPDQAHPICGGIVGDPRPCEMFVSVDARMMDGPPRSAAA